MPRHSQRPPSLVLCLHFHCIPSLFWHSFLAGRYAAGLNHSLHVPQHVLWCSQIDKEGANPERAKTQLSEQGLMPEEWGGQTPMVEVLALFLALQACCVMSDLSAVCC